MVLQTPKGKTWGESRIISFIYDDVGSVRCRICLFLFLNIRCILKSNATFCIFIDFDFHYNVINRELHIFGLPLNWTPNFISMKLNLNLSDWWGHTAKIVMRAFCVFTLTRLLFGFIFFIFIYISPSSCVRNFCLQNSIHTSFSSTLHTYMDKIWHHCVVLRERYPSRQSTFQLVRMVFLL